MLKIILKRELRNHVRSKAFLVATFGMPLFYIALFIFMVGSFFLAERILPKEDRLPVGLYIQSGSSELDGPFAHLSTKETISFKRKLTKKDSRSSEDKYSIVNIVLFPEHSSGISALRQNKVSAFFVLTPYVLSTGKVNAYFLKNGEKRIQPSEITTFEHFLRKEMLASTNTPPRISKLIQEGVSYESLLINTAGEVLPKVAEKGSIIGTIAEILQNGFQPIVRTIFFFVLLINTSHFLTCINSERESKLYELMLSAVSASDLLTAKVLALTIAGLLQFGIWLAVFLYFPFLMLVLCSFVIPVDFGWTALLLSLIFLAGGLMMYGFLLAGLGAIIRNPKELNGSNVILGMAFGGVLVPLMTLLSHGGATLWRILSAIPVFTPVLVPVQLGKPQYSIWEGVLYIIPLLLGIYAAKAFSIHLFKIGLKYSGSDPGARIILRDLVPIFRRTTRRSSIEGIMKLRG